MDVTIVIPCLNEAETLASCIRKALKAFAENNLQGEVVVADNGSTDGSQAIAEAEGARVVPVPLRGYGAALIGGINAAQGEFIIMGDADDSYDFAETPKFVAKLRAGYDFVMGCRFPKGGGTIMPNAMPRLHRYLGTPVLTFLARLFFKHPFRDINCGMRGFRKTAIQSLNLRCTGMEFASEMVSKACLSGLNVTEIPITLHKDGRSRPPHLRSWRDGWRHLRFMLLLSPFWLYKIPAYLFLGVGTLLTLILSVGEASFGGVTLSVNSLIMAEMMVVLGTQLLIFGTFVTRYAQQEGLLPRPSKMFRGHIIEIAMVAGAGLFLLGCLGVAHAVLTWKDLNYGNITDIAVTRNLSLSGMSIVIGLQIAFAGFLFGILDLKSRRM